MSALEMENTEKSGKMASLCTSGVSLSSSINVNFPERNKIQKI